MGTPPDRRTAPTEAVGQSDWLCATDPDGREQVAGAGAAVDEPPVGRRLDAREVRRRLWHIAPGLLPFLLWFFPHEDPLSATLTAILIAIVVALTLAILVRRRRIARPHEHDFTTAVMGYAGPVLGTLLLFPGQAELGMTVLGVLAFGDGVATLGGLGLSGPRLPWNRRKTWAGSICFLLGAVPLSSAIYWGEAQPAVSVSVALTCGGVTSVVAAVAESLPSRVNDNVRVGISAVLAVVVVHAAMVGWH